MQIIDLTHTFTDNMPVYPGDPPSSLKQIASIEKDTYTDHQINSYMHVGTHMDAPLHMIPDGQTMDQIDPQYFFGQGMLIDARNKESINESLLKDKILPEQSIVLIYTGYAEKYRTSAYYENFPSMTAEFAKQMVDKNVKIVGMDILGPDIDPNWPAHKILLGNNILIIENMANLDKLLEVKNFEIIALPAKYQAEAAPVRVLAIQK
ncbi:MAG TPA: cyclase family protein [Candidatus Nitrosocosmicus sp.]|nr:cyclase family protein [Candidatus Nitrosocosmicus sp.]